MPQVSVIIPSYNSVRYIEEAVESALRQTYADIEVIVVDDGSTDGTRAALGELIRTKRIRYLAQENGGPARARNTGIRAARGRYLAFLDADDVWRPDKLRVQLDLLARHPQFRIVHTGVEVRDAQGRALAGVLYDNPAREGWLFEDILLCRSWIFLSTVLVERSVLESVGLFNESLPTAEDTNLFLRIARAHRFGYIGRALVIRRSHGGNMTEQDAGASGTFRNLDDIAARYADLFCLHSLMSKAYAVRYTLAGCSVFRDGDYARARPLLRKALAYRPMDPKAALYFAASFLPAGLMTRVRQVKRGALRRMERVIRAQETSLW